MGSIDFICEKERELRKQTEKWNCLWWVFFFRLGKNSANWKCMWSLCCVRCVCTDVWIVRCVVCVVYSGINGWKSFAHVFSPFYGTMISNSFSLSLCIEFQFLFSRFILQFTTNKTKQSETASVCNKWNKAIWIVTVFAFIL